GEAIHDALYRAYFVDGVNVGDVEALLKVAAATGLDVEVTREVLESRSFSDAVDEDWAKSRQYGVTGVPTFIAGRQGVVGAQPYEALEQLLQQAGVEPRS
ncbi:MAG: DsbA family protein, partial [Alphaproteobacteria bacterium]|nr:DsbA family protein [Alphaproteobacteria bacterium]